MEKSSRLYPEETRAVCEEVINTLLSQNEQYNVLAGAIKDLVTEPSIQGTAYSTMKQHISDYGLVVVSIVAANELCISRCQTLEVMVGDEILDGDEIISTIEKYDRLISNEYQNAHYWEQDRQRNNESYDSSENPYLANVNNYTAIRGVWIAKRDKYDNIESVTAPFFDEVNYLLAKASTFLTEIENRTINGATVSIDENSTARIELSEALRDTLEAIENEDVFRANLNPIDTMEEIEEFWLYDSMFDYPYWYQNEENMYIAIEYLRREIEINGPYFLIHDGYQTEAERVKQARIMVLINLLANASIYDPFDRTLTALENTCLRYGYDLYSGIGFDTDSNQFIITEEFLEILIRNENERIGQEFGFWLERGGGDAVDAIINPATSVEDAVVAYVDDTYGDIFSAPSIEDYSYNSGAYNLDGYVSEYDVNFDDIEVIVPEYENVESLTSFYIL